MVVTVVVVVVMMILMVMAVMVMVLVRVVYACVSVCLTDCLTVCPCVRAYVCREPKKAPPKNKRDHGQRLVPRVHAWTEKWKKTTHSTTENKHSFAR